MTIFLFLVVSCRLYSFARGLAKDNARARNIRRVTSQVHLKPSSSRTRVVDEKRIRLFLKVSRVHTSVAGSSHFKIETIRRHEMSRCVRPFRIKSTDRTGVYCFRPVPPPWRTSNNLLTPAHPVINRSHSNFFFWQLRRCDIGVFETRLQFARMRANQFRCTLNTRRKPSPLVITEVL